MHGGPQFIFSNAEGVGPVAPFIVLIEVDSGSVAATSLRWIVAHGIAPQRQTTHASHAAARLSVRVALTLK